MDPLQIGPDRTRELFTRLSKECQDYPRDAVVGAVANLLLNALRQGHARRDKAAAAFDELVARWKAVLMEHYNGIGERRNIFPFHQTLEMPHLVARRERDGKTILVPTDD